MTKLPVKKLFSLLIALVFILSAVNALAAEIDLSSFTDDEIIALAGKINEEIVARKIEKTATLSKGTYYAGTDLPAGTYIFTCLAKGSDWGNVTIRANKGKGSQKLWEIASAPEGDEDPETFRITLEDDDALESDVPFSLTISAGRIIFQ